MRYTEYYNQPSPELGELADITVVTDAILAGEKNQSGKIEFLKATNTGDTINLISDCRDSKLTKHYNGLTVAFFTPVVLTESDTKYQLKIDDLPAQPFKVKTASRNNALIIASFDSTNGFVSTESAIPRSSATNSNSEITVATSKAVNDLKTIILNKNIIAGKGLSGGGDLSDTVIIDINSANDSIVINDDNIQINTVNNLTTSSATRPLSANMGVELNKKIDAITIDSLDGAHKNHNHDDRYATKQELEDTLQGTVFVRDIVDNLTTTDSKKPLSANMGVELDKKTIFNIEQLLYNFKSLSSTVYIDNSNPQLQFNLQYHDTKHLFVPKSVLYTGHVFTNPSPQLNHGSVKLDIRNISLKITSVHNYKQSSPQLIQTLTGGK